VPDINREASSIMSSKAPETFAGTASRVPARGPRLVAPRPGPSRALLRSVRAAALALVLVLAGQGVARAELAVGAQFPGLSETLGEAAAQAHLSGKVVVVDFWASWCTPCRTSFPILSRLQQEFPDRLAIVGVSVDEKQSAYEQFVRRLKPSFLTLRDAGQRLAALVRVPTMPTSYVLDRSGRVRFVHAGFHGDTAGQLRSQIRQLLEENP
jgi:thiol-disulfide isomerase/thioredoxin